METIREFFENRRKRDRAKVHKMKKNFKYFKPGEIIGLAEDLVWKLDRTREYYGHPIIITSGLRTSENNALVKGVKNSAHLTGLAVDIKVPVNQQLRERLTWAIGRGGFDRVGFYDRHAHLDIDKHKPAPAYWNGVS